MRSWGSLQDILDPINFESPDPHVPYAPENRFYQRQQNYRNYIRQQDSADLFSNTNYHENYFAPVRGVPVENRIQARASIANRNSFFNRNPMAGAALASAGGNVLSSTLGGMFGLIGRGMQNSFEADQQKKKFEFENANREDVQQWDNSDREDKQAFQLQLDFERMKQAQQMYAWQNQQRADALAQAGLPAYLAQMPGLMNAGPRMSQRLPGGGLYTSQLPGDPRTSQWSNNPIQASMGWGAVPNFR